MPTPLTLHSAAAATGNGTIVQVSPELGHGGGIVIEIVTGFTGYVTFEGSQDDSVYYPIVAYSLEHGVRVSRTRVAGLYFIPTAGLSSVRAPFTRVAGTLTAKAYATKDLGVGSKSGFAAAQLMAETITTAGTVNGTALLGLLGARHVIAFVDFAYGSGGMTAKAFLQTSLDLGASWMDIAQFDFATASLGKVHGVNVLVATAANLTPGDGTLAANTIVNGVLGDRLRMKLISTGTYAGGTVLTGWVIAKG